MVPQSGGKEQFYSTVYCITLNEVLNLTEHLKIWKNVEDRFRYQNECMGDCSVHFLLFKGKIYV